MTNCLPSVDPRVWGADVWDAVNLLFDPTHNAVSPDTVYDVALEISAALPCAECGRDARSFITSNPKLFAADTYLSGASRVAFCTLRERVQLKTGRQPKALLNQPSCPLRGITFLRNWRRRQPGGHLENALAEVLNRAQKKLSP